MSVLEWGASLLIAAACLYWIAIPLVGLHMSRSVPRLIDVDDPVPDEWPRVSIIAPACNEADTVEAAVRSWLKSDYPNLEIIAVDDRSTDDTRAILTRLAANDERVTLVCVDELPAGWLGKTHAMHQGSQSATGDYLLLTDADVHQSPDALRRAVAHARHHGRDHLAVLPDISSHGFWLDVALAAFGRGFIMGQRVWKVSDPDSSAFVGVGAFNLLRREAFLACGGFAELKLDIADDLAVGHLMKTSGRPCGVAAGTDLIGLSWYGSLGDMVHGLEKNVFPLMQFKVWLAALFALLVVFFDLAPFLALFAPLGSPWLPYFGVAALAGIAGAAFGAKIWMRRPFLPGLAIPFSGMIMAWIFLRSAWVGSRNGGVLWRGTFYPAETLRGKMRVTFP